MAARALEQVKKDFPNLDVEPIEVTKHPIVTLKAGILMVPALKINNATLSGIFLSRKKMQDFIADQINIQSSLDRD